MVTHITCWKNAFIGVWLRLSVCAGCSWKTGTCGAGFHHCSWDNTVLVSPSLSIPHTSSFFFFLLVSSVALYSLLPLSQARTQSHKPSKRAFTKAEQIHHRFKQDLHELQMASYWSVHSPDLSLLQSENAAEGCRVWQGHRWESRRPQKGWERWEFQTGVERIEHGKVLRGGVTG